MHDFNQSYYLEQLSHHHRLFYAVFELGRPQFTKSISTAAVGLNLTNGEVTFLVNPDFFYSLGENEQLFIICHEALHVILNHMDRTVHLDLDPELSNIAQDIVINETLVSQFGFDRSLLSFSQTLCFIDTVFSQEQIDKHNIVQGKSFEFYYQLLAQYFPQKKPLVFVLDQHMGSMNGEGQDFQIVTENGDIIIDLPPEIAEQIANKIGHQLTAEELEELLESLRESYQRGIGATGKSLYIQLEEKKKRPWERIIKNKIASLQKTINKNHETFRFRPRRITNLPENLHLPETNYEDIKENDKFNIIFFIDASGSCSSYQSQFFNLVRSVPEDKFNVNVYSFDSQTYQLDLKNLFTKGGGGTNFDILEEQVQHCLKNDPTFHKKYPDLVFILSDGDGNSVYPEKPERWYFLLTYNQTRHIPSKANIILLSDFTKNEPKVTVKNLERI